MPVDNTMPIMSLPLRRVSFKENDEVLEIPCRRDSKRERHTISFSSKDLKGMRLREKRLSQKFSVRRGINIVEDDMTGLFSFDDNSQRCKRIKDGISSVLTEQENQCVSGGIRDHEYIAQRYSRAVNESKLLARNRGFDTAVQVEEESEEEEDFLRPMSYSPIIHDPNPYRWDMGIADSEIGTVFEIARKPCTMRGPITRMIVIPIDDMPTRS